MHELLNPRMGDQARLLPICLHQISVRHEHRAVISVSNVEVIVIQ
jgi:hypothetical protein